MIRTILVKRIEDLISAIKLDLRDEIMRVLMRHWDFKRLPHAS